MHVASGGDGAATGERAASTRGTGGFGDKIVGKNLTTIHGSDEVPHILFAAMAICPEDIPVPSEALEMVWCSKTRAQLPLPSIAKMKIRMAIITLLNRNLLLGAPGAWVYMHDVVRDYSRTLPSGSEILEQQRTMVQLLLAAQPPNAGFEIDDGSPLTEYAISALRQHMVEAIEPLLDPGEDQNALRWLSYAPNRVLSDFATLQAGDTALERVPPRRLAFLVPLPPPPKRWLGDLDALAKRAGAR